MKLILVPPIVLLIFPKCTPTLENIYSQMNSVYNQYQNKHNRRAVPIQWDEMSKPLQTFSTPPNISKEYDFIIVGSGSAGSVIANRLSEVPNWKVLLLEVGTPENIWSQIPLVAPTMAFTPYNWDYLAEYQPNSGQGFNQQRMLWPRGKALGGTSVINFMIYTRGNRLDYERWGQANPGWSYQDVLPYYIKSERANLKEEDCRYHGTHGYLSVESIYRSPLVDRFIKAGNELGLPHYDYNANVRPFGVSAIQATVLNGKRHTVAQAFLHSVRHRSNLDILTSAFVTKVLINPHTKQAYGVEYERFGKKYAVRARKEVILSAGTFNSPQLLMLAGIGPKQHLQELGIPLLKDLPVGLNLHDHLTYPGLSFLINKEVSLSLDKILDYKNLQDFFLNGTGPYTSLGGVEAIGYIKTEESKELDNIPDVELIFMDGSLSTDFGFFNRRWMNIRDDFYNSVYAPTHEIPSYTVFPMLLHPKSTGYLKLRSKDPHDYPLFYGNYLTDPEDHDVKTFLAAIRFIQRLSKTKAFRKLGATLNRNHMPGCERYKFDSDDYWKCAIRAISVTLHHQVGTAKMGPAHDPTSVVDHELKVHGIKGLRVSDCSVIPFAIGAHTNAVSIMIGEKTSDIIKRNYEEFTEPLTNYVRYC